MSTAREQLRNAKDRPLVDWVASWKAKWQTEAGNTPTECKQAAYAAAAERQRVAIRILVLADGSRTLRSGVAQEMRDAIEHLIEPQSPHWNRSVEDALVFALASFVGRV